MQERAKEWLDAGLVVKAEEPCLPIFERFIKDSVEDELADCYIRLCDFAVGYGMDTDIIIEGVAWDRQFFKAQSVGNLGQSLLLIAGGIYGLSEPVEDTDVPWEALKMRGVLVAIECLALDLGIDLARHIDLKLTYNSLRPHKHGKSY